VSLVLFVFSVLKPFGLSAFISVNLWLRFSPC
jgi:hypothetical protein